MGVPRRETSLALFGPHASICYSGIYKLVVTVINHELRVLDH